MMHSLPTRASFWSFVAASALALSFGGCGGESTGTGGSGGQGSGGAGGSPSVDAACTEYAAAQCAGNDQCGPLFLELSYGDVATCKTRMKARCVADFELDGVTATASDVQACAAALAGVDCNGFLADFSTACGFPGSRADGEACAVDAQCAGAICDLSAGDCGVCRTALAEGATCDPMTFYECGSGRYCSGETMKCSARAKENAACTPATICEGTLACVDGKCTKGAGEGAPCPTYVECDLFNGIGCNFADPPVCAKYVLAKVGESCAEATTFCDHEGQCNFDTFTCEAVAADGEACSETIGCQYLASCVDQVCTLDAPQCD